MLSSMFSKFQCLSCMDDEEGEQPDYQTQKILATPPPTEAHAIGSPVILTSTKDILPTTVDAEQAVVETVVEAVVENISEVTEKNLSLVAYFLFPFISVVFVTVFIFTLFITLPVYFYLFSVSNLFSFFLENFSLSQTYLHIYVRNYYSNNGVQLRDDGISVLLFLCCEKKNQSLYSLNSVFRTRKR